MSFVKHVSSYFLVYFIGLIVLWSYYAYVIEMCIIWCEVIPQKIIYIIIYHVVLFFFVFCYFKAITAKRATMPVEFYLNSEEHEKSMEMMSNQQDFQAYLNDLVKKKNLPLKTRDISSNVRFCGVCQMIKPDRAHHCSTCNTCLLRMDHHCPWVGSCVALHNHKFFIQFLGYGSLYCLWIFATTIEFAIRWWNSQIDKNMRGINFVLLVVISVMFCLIQASLCGYHIYLTVYNLTTLESMRRSIFVDKEITSFDLGKLENLRQMFGPRFVDMFLPTYASMSDGVDYQTKRKMSDYRTLEEHQ